MLLFLKCGFYCFSDIVRPTDQELITVEKTVAASKEEGTCLYWGGGGGGEWGYIGKPWGKSGGGGGEVGKSFIAVSAGSTGEVGKQA